MPRLLMKPTASIPAMMQPPCKTNGIVPAVFIGPICWAFIQNEYAQSPVYERNSFDVHDELGGVGFVFSLANRILSLLIRSVFPEEWRFLHLCMITSWYFVCLVTHDSLASLEIRLRGCEGVFHGLADLHHWYQSLFCAERRKIWDWNHS